MKRHFALLALVSALAVSALAQIRIYDTIYAAGGPPHDAAGRGNVHWRSPTLHHGRWHRCLAKQPCPTDSL